MLTSRLRLGLPTGTRTPPYSIPSCHPRTLVRSLALCCVIALALPVGAQTPDIYSDIHWRQIGPTRAGRARAVAGVPSQRNVAYIGIDNGGVWRSTNHGPTWHHLFDTQRPGLIVHIGV